MAEEKTSGQERTLQEAMTLLDEQIDRLQDNTLPLEDAFQAYRQGMELLKQCEQKLDLVEKQVMQINEQGQVVERQMELADDEQDELLL